jgi:hypothetical protein
MKMLLNKLKNCTNQFKLQNILMALSLSTLVSMSYAHTSCPQLTINAACINGAWQIAISPQGAHWELMGEQVNGQPCTEGKTQDLRWNYAFSSARFGIVGCNYSLYNNLLGLIGPIQIKSAHYMPRGSNWRSSGYPGNFTCDQSQENCLFSD